MLVIKLWLITPFQLVDNIIKKSVKLFQDKNNEVNKFLGYVKWPNVEV